MSAEAEYLAPEPIFVPHKAQTTPAFSRQEKDVFEPYKELYRREANARVRASLIKDKILPDIFNFWHRQGITPLTGEQWGECIM
ncbi:hypothetical protein C0991_000711, partial [Blastosporella zonata]